MPISEARTVAAMTLYAATLALAYPTSTPEALADKLFTVFGESARAVRLTVAEAALTAAPTLVA